MYTIQITICFLWELDQSWSHFFILLLPKKFLYYPLTSLKQKNKYLNNPQGKILSLIKESKINVILWPRKQGSVFQEVTKDGIMTSKRIWCTIKPFLNHLHWFHRHRKTWKPNKQQTELVELLQEHYINIEEKRVLWLKSPCQ